MISLHVLAEDLSPSHLLAAIKHWLSKFEQEIMHVDDGPAPAGKYEFEHDGKATEVHWHPTYGVNTDGLTINAPALVPVTPLGTEPPLSDEEILRLKLEHGAVIRRGDAATPALVVAPQAPAQAADPGVTASEIPALIASVGEVVAAQEGSVTPSETPVA